MSKEFSYKRAFDNVQVTENFKNRVLNNVRQAQKPISRQYVTFKYAIYALAFILLLSFTVATTVEANEYNEAIEFFKENELPLEGLTRDETKKVYKDIKLGTFSYEKTEEIIEKITLNVSVTNLTNIVGSEETANLWNNYVADRLLAVHNGIKTTDIINYVDAENNDYLIERYKGLKIEKIVNSEVEWTYFDNAWNTYGEKPRYTQTSYGTYVYGVSYVDRDTNEYNYKGEKQFIIELFDNDGNVLWRKTSATYAINYPFTYSSCAVYADENGVTLFGRIYEDNDCYITMIKINKDGEPIWHIKNHYPVDMAPESACKYKNGYLVKLGNYEKGQVVFMSDDGKTIEQKTFDIDGIRYYPQDILNIDGKVYISAMAIKVFKDDDITGDINRLIFDEKKDAEKLPITLNDGEALKKVREIYDSALLVLDENGNLSAVNITKHARAGQLYFRDGNIHQQVKYIDAISYAVYNSRPFDLVESEYIFRFDISGNVIDETKWGVIVEWFPVRFEPFNK